jgi:hypothetical protein
MQTIDELQIWLNMATKACGNDIIYTSFLMGTKLDLLTNGITNTQMRDINGFIEYNKLQGGFWSTSSKSGEGVVELFNKVIEYILWYAVVPTQTQRV